MKKLKASSIVYIIFFLVSLLAFCAFAIDGTITLTNRAKLQNITEMTALAAAAEFKYSLTANKSSIETHVVNSAQNTFNLLKRDSLSSANINVIADAGATNKVTVTTNFISQPFFLSFIGVSGINLQAKAIAVSESLDVNAKYTNINWVTPSAVYLSDILSKNLNMNDTAILLPLGDFYSASYDNLATGYVYFNFINNNGDNIPLSLGPGGFITIKLPSPIIDKPGNDLYIKELGALEGYMVFAGLDNNPDNPYMQKGREGDGISWINISCSGTPEITDINGLVGGYTISTDNLGIQNRFFGSAYFDLGDSCTGGISMAKYIRIVDDNNESAFVTSGTSTTSNSYYKAMIYGEASTATAGADIDFVRVLNHVRLVSN